MVNGIIEVKYSFICFELENYICGVGFVGNDLIFEWNGIICILLSEEVYFNCLVMSIRL